MNIRSEKHSVAIATGRNSACSGRPVLFIRNNPDAFKIMGLTKRTTNVVREAALLQAGLYFEDFSHLIAIHFVCYDNVSNDNLVQTYK